LAVYATLNLMSGVLRRYTELAFLIDFLRTKELVLLSPNTWDDKNDAHYIDQYAKARGFDEAYALCLTEALERYHHWKIFSSGSGGVCIEFKKEPLLGYAQKVVGLRAGPVRYRTIPELRATRPDQEDFPFLKREAFSDDLEFRLFLACLKAPVKPVRFHVPLAIVSRVTLSPWLPTTVADNVKATLKAIDGCKALKIYRSTLVENEAWKRLAPSRH
jgi:hypothetical protein